MEVEGQVKRSLYDLANDIEEKIQISSWNLVQLGIINRLATIVDHKGHLRNCCGLGTMNNKIEKFLLNVEGQPSIQKFEIGLNYLNVTISSWEKSNVVRTFEFSEYKPINISFSEEAEDCELPWDVHGVSCEEIGNNLWRFCIHCDGCELNFSSCWPKLLS